MSYPSIPKWMDEVNEESHLNSRDIASLFGIKRQHIKRWSQTHGFPEGIRTCKSKPNLVWSIKTVKDFLNNKK